MSPPVGGRVNIIDARRLFLQFQPFQSQQLLIP